MTTVFDFTVTDIHGKPVNRADYRANVRLSVNTASNGGVTPK